ncbi:MAG: hypothetical protein C4524_06085 [Candidatus Zixiibacteriota bacterium]|nr:MAG: hypothetical protein C4524_06085 [candidate division Zixibacteria bacterium]
MVGENFGGPGFILGVSAEQPAGRGQPDGGFGGRGPVGEAIPGARGGAQQGAGEEGKKAADGRVLRWIRYAYCKIISPARGSKLFPRKFVLD